MFYVNFLAVDGMENMGADAISAGFIVGAVAIVLVQGGIGVYPTFVGLTVTMYMPGVSSGIAPEALAMGWIAWISQFLMIVVTGLISLAMVGKKTNLASHEPSSKG
jgi:Flp pilus assembly pilin Flp